MKLLVYLPQMPLSRSGAVAWVWITLEPCGSWNEDRY
eukprot:SAG11_NODE_2851_length_2906_cov_1.849662_1_plen_36_part_10